VWSGRRRRPIGHSGRFCSVVLAGAPHSLFGVDAAAGEVVLTDAVASFVQVLGDRLIAAVALGSLAHGGFSELVSDVDIGLVLTDDVGPSDAEAIEVVTGEVRTGGTPLHQRLSVFWATLSDLHGGTEGGRFPPLDRLDLIENGRLLFGSDPRDGMPRPTRAELFVVGAEFALDFLAGEEDPNASGAGGLGSMRPGDAAVTRQMRDPSLLFSQGPRRLTKLVLFPVRFLFTARTGEVGTNELAVEHYRTDPDAPAKELVDAALRWRLAAPSTDEAVDLLRQGLVPLYLYLIADHRQRLGAEGREDLARRYEAWRDRLLA
jgi:hypothetical protein